MCCRYWTDQSPQLREIVEEMNRSPLTEKWRWTAEVKTFGEIRPGDVAAVIAPDKQGRKKVYPMKWGYTGRSLLLNARAETAAVKPTFREDWARHRCIVPASWYFEWEHLTGKEGKKRTGPKYRLRPKEASLTWLCGLYRIENGFPVFVILTREPGEGISFIHDRMPLILPDSLVEEWIRPDADPQKILPCALTDMTFEKAE